MLRLTLLVFLLGNVVTSDPLFDVIFEWNYIEYNWPSGDSPQQSNIHKEYIAENNAIAGIKLWKDKMYLAIPRWKNGVPVTLAVTSATPVNDDKSPKLDPYPSWEMQALGNCSAFQFVHSMEIDPLGRMWVLDTGRTETMFPNPGTNCPPRLVILDLENDGKVLKTYNFPNNVSPKASAYLNDIVLDHEDGGMAFITDSGHDDPGIIVYSLKDNESWKVRHHSMKAQPDSLQLEVAGTKVSSPVHVNGIALSPPGLNRVLYYSPFSSLHMYSIPVSVLKNTSLENIDEYVNDLGLKSSQTDGMIMTNQGVLYFGILKDDAIAMWDSKSNPSFNTGLRTIFEIHVFTQWPNTFAIDEGGRLWCVVNSLQNFVTNNVDKSRPNYRALRSSTRAKNYQYFSDGTAPQLPVITAAADRITLALSSFFIVALVFFAR